MQEKKSLKYYFSTEGETEKWYLEHIANLINNDASSNYKLSFSIKKVKPLAFVKRISILNPTEIYHLFDIESLEPEYKERFIQILDDMHAAENLGKDITYIPIYSNLTFELWIILHKIACNNVIDRKNYLNFINKAFNTKYESLKEYKEEKHFKEILKKITLEDVKLAIRRAEKIMTENQNRGYVRQRKYKYSWYWENPATEMGTIIKKILSDCTILK